MEDYKEINIAFEKAYPEDGPEFIGGMWDVFKEGWEGRQCQIDKLDKELQILHELCFELYNYDNVLPLVKKALEKIKMLKNEQEKQLP